MVRRSTISSVLAPGATEGPELWLVRAEALHAAGEHGKRDRALAAAAASMERAGIRAGL